MQNRFVVLVLAFLLTTAAASPGVAAQEPVAWLTQATGDVTVRRAAADDWVRTGEVVLYLGDAVRTGRLSRALIVFANAERMTLSGGEMLEISAPGEADTGVGTEVGKAVATLVIDAWNGAIGRSDATGTGAARPPTGTTPPILERPRFGYVLDAAPTLRWLAARPAMVDGQPVHYRIAILRDEGAEPCFDGPVQADLVWAHTTSDTTLVYPADAPPLDAGGDYYVEVHRSDLDGGRPSDVAWDCFTVATDSARTVLTALRRSLGDQYLPASEPEPQGEATHSDVAADDVTADLIYAAVLLDQEFYADALAVLDGIEAREPGLAAARRLRSFVYEEAGPPTLVDALRDEAASADPE